jgi:hypothetical protein
MSSARLIGMVSFVFPDRSRTFEVDNCVLRAVSRTTDARRPSSDVDGKLFPLKYAFEIRRTPLDTESQVLMIINVETSHLFLSLGLHVSSTVSAVLTCLSTSIVLCASDDASRQLAVVFASRQHNNKIRRRRQHLAVGRCRRRVRRKQLRRIDQCDRDVVNWCHVWRACTSRR